LGKLRKIADIAGIAVIARKSPTTPGIEPHLGGTKDLSKKTASREFGFPPGTCSRLHETSSRTLRSPAKRGEWA